MNIQAYTNFIRERAGNLNWPDFDVGGFSQVFKPPSKTTFKNVFDTSFSLIFPHLERDLYSRLPGKMVSHDGPYEKKTRTTLCLTMKQAALMSCGANMGMFLPGLSLQQKMTNAARV